MTTAEFISIRDEIANSATADLWAVLRRPMVDEEGCYRLSNAKQELRRRGFSVV